MFANSSPMYYYLLTTLLISFHISFPGKQVPVEGLLIGTETNSSFCTVNRAQIEIGDYTGFCSNFTDINLEEFLISYTGIVKYRDPDRNETIPFQFNVTDEEILPLLNGNFVCFKFLIGNELSSCDITIEYTNSYRVNFRHVEARQNFFPQYLIQWIPVYEPPTLELQTLEWISSFITPAEEEEVSESVAFGIVALFFSMFLIFGLVTYCTYKRDQRKDRLKKLARQPIRGNCSHIDDVNWTPHDVKHWLEHDCKSFKSGFSSDEIMSVPMTVREEPST